MTESVDDYLKAILIIGGEEGRVTTSVLARHLGITPASVTGMLRKLSSAKPGWVVYEKNRGARLTETGRRRALEILRHHRLIESFLHNTLGYPWDEVHAEAERLEHVISETLEDSIERHLGYPETDPHGAPIPRRDGTVPARRERCLLDIEAGATVTISSVTDTNADLLRYLGDLGLYPGVEITVTSVEPFGGPVCVRQAEGTIHPLGRDAAEQIRVVAPQPKTGAVD